MAITVVNSVAAANSYGTSASTIATAATSLTGGNAIFAFTRCDVQLVTSVTDTASNTYVNIFRWTTPETVVLEVWQALNVTGNASNVVTATFAASATGRALETVQCTSIAAKPYNGGASVSHGSGTSIVTPNWTITAAGAIVFLYANNNDGVSNTWTAPTGFTKEVASSIEVATVFYKVVTTETTQNRTVSATSSAIKDMAVIILTETASSGASGGAWAYA
jgi:hypothetical protein